LTRTHKSTISARFTAADETATGGTRRKSGRPPRIRPAHDRKGKALYEKLIPRLKRKEQVTCRVSRRRSAEILR